MGGKVEQTVSGKERHHGEVNSLVFHSNHLFSGGTDGKIKVWDQDLQFVKDIYAHNAPIIALAITSNGLLYSSSNDKTIKCFQEPIISNVGEEIYRVTDDNDMLRSLCCDDDGNLFSGNSAGILTKFVFNKVYLLYNLKQEVKWMSVEKHILYTTRDDNIVVTELLSGQHLGLLAIMEGKGPIGLVGPIEDGQSKYLVFATKDGQGITLVRNEDPHPIMWTQKAAHELTITTLCGTNDCLYTAGNDGKVKKWVDLDKGPHMAGAVDTGICINHICIGPENSVYVSDTAGNIKRVTFSTVGA